MDELWLAVISSAVPIVLGGLTERFNFFLEPLQDFLDRVKRKKGSLIESLATKHADLLAGIRQLGPDDLLRGYVTGPRNSDPDMIGAFTEETFRLVQIFQRLGMLTFVVRTGHTVLLFTTVAGLVGVVCSFLVPTYRPLIFDAGLIVAGIQIACVFVVYFAARKLDVYDEVA